MDSPTDGAPPTRGTESLRRLLPRDSGVEGDPRRAIAYIVRSYPRLSQTFIVNEILSLERLGLRICVFALADSRESLVQEVVGQLRAPVEYLPQPRGYDWIKVVFQHLRLAVRAPRRYLRTCVYVMRNSELDSGYTTCSRWVCFLHAAYLAKTLPRLQDSIKHVHAHFAHDPALIALLLRKLTGASYSFTAHARDLYQTPPSKLAERIEEASAVVTCCRANAEYLRPLAGSAKEKLHVIYHGVDTQRFRPARQGGMPGGVPLILAIGRLVSKKGYPDLIEACARLKKQGYDFRCVIYGEGPLFGQLSASIRNLQLDDRIVLAGEATQQDLSGALGQADVFALTPYVTADGDRDGIPNALLEAMACGLPPVTTTVGGIPEVVVHDHNGLLSKPRDVSAITAHLATLISDHPRRLRLGSGARQTMVDRFDHSAAARSLEALFGSCLGSQA